MRLALAVTANRFDVLVDNAVLSNGIMVFNVFVFNLSKCVIALPSDRGAGVSCFLCCAAVSEQTTDNIARANQILRISRLILPQD